MPMTRRHIWENITKSTPADVLESMSSKQLAALISAANISFHDGKAANGDVAVIDGDAVWIGHGVDKLVPLAALKAMAVTEQTEYRLRHAGHPAPDGRQYYLADGTRIDYAQAYYKQRDCGEAIYVQDRIHTTDYKLQYTERA